MIFEPRTLADTLSETAGYKAGLALSLEELFEHLDDGESSALVRASEEHSVRIRSEDYDHLFYRLLHRIGYTSEEYDGDIAGAGLYHKYKNTALREWTGVTELFARMWPQIMQSAEDSGSKSLDPTPYLRAAMEEFGSTGYQIAVERLLAISRGLRMSPHGRLRYTEWTSAIALQGLFGGTGQAPHGGRFIDQRYIDYLSTNPGRLAQIHWRKFEELTSEFFHREGFDVSLGPGSNDDGVDVRVWKPGTREESSPHFLIQCKRQKAKVEKVVVKGLYADVTHEKADYGLVVTTSELSVGARTTITARAYPIEEVDRHGVEQWLDRLRTPGTGIVRF